MGVSGVERFAVQIKVSPAAGAVKWPETSSENAWPSLALWLVMAVPVGPVSPTARVKLSLTEVPCGWEEGTVRGLPPYEKKTGVPEITPVPALMLRPAGRGAEKVKVSPAAGA